MVEFSKVFMEPRVSLLQFNKVTKIFKADIFGKSFKALDELSFSVDEGSLIGFLGANGAGKTTSIKILMGFIDKNEGEIVFSDKLGKSKDKILSNIGYFPERPYFYPNLTGREFITYVGKLNDLSIEKINSAAAYWGERFKISFAYDRKINSYSKGMLQRLGFVCSLVHDPLLLILDEPLSGLDPIGRKEIKDVMRELKKEGKTVFFSSHIVSDVEEVCEKVVVIEKGKLIYQGEIDTILHSGDENVSGYELSYKGQMKAEFQQYLLHEKGNIITLDIAQDVRDETIKIILNSGFDLLSLQKHKISLEEFVYKVRK